MSIITVFFSMKGETIAPGMKIVTLDKGNTAWAAEYVQKAVGGDLFELKTKKTYRSYPIGGITKSSVKNASDQQGLGTMFLNHRV